MANIIISYNHQNEDIARTLADDIGVLGHDVWFDQELSGGQAWWDRILERIRNCDIFVFVLAPEALNSTACKREYEYAADLGKPILPVLIAESLSINLLPSALSQIQYVDYRKHDRNAALQLARALTDVPPAKDLPDQLPSPPEAPISYLGNLAKQIETISTLSYEKQSELVVDLKKSLRDPEAADDAHTLLKRLRKQQNLFAPIADEIDELLKSTRKESSVESESQVTQLLTEQPASPKPLIHEKQDVQEVEETIPGELDHPKPTDLGTKKAWSKSQKIKVLAVICIVAFIVIISTIVFSKYGQPKAGDVVTNSIGMKLVYIPAGSFMMGSSLSKEELDTKYVMKPSESAHEFPQHQVRISKGLWMGQTEVTQARYESIMNAQPWSGKDDVREDGNNPAVYVSWDDAVEFCMRLSQKVGGIYRLPTEAEWEYACWADTTTPYSFGDSRSSLDYYAWFDGNALNVGQKYAHPVGRKNHNRWGLYDMHGNVWEWCSDWYDPDYYSNSPTVDPQGPSSNAPGTPRCLRGGSWNNYDGALRSSFRGRSLPVNGDSKMGFRVVLSQ